MIDLTPFSDFEAVSRAVLTFLQKRLGFSLWMVTRTEGSDWIVLQARDVSYGVDEGTVFRWTDSFCSRMVLGQGPRVAPRASEIPVYTEAPIGRQVQIGAYIGVPLAKSDGTLFGTLCAIDPEPQSESLVKELPLIELLARMLMTALTMELEQVARDRLLEGLELQATTDALTGLLNRRGWDRSVEMEEARARRYGSPCCALVLDLDDLKLTNDRLGHVAGDDLIRRAARIIRHSVRENDIVARLGGDEFGVLAIECDLAGSDILFENLTRALNADGIKASIGKAMRNPSLGLLEATAEADRFMYAAKAAARASRHCSSDPMS